MPRARAARAARVKKTTARRDTGPDAATRRLVLDRAAGACELCGRLLHDGTRWLGDHSHHHRRPRGMGGSRDAATNTAANLLLLCGSGTTGCHGTVESDRTAALEHGWLVAQGQDPATTPVLVIGPVVLHRVRLTLDGRYEVLSW